MAEASLAESACWVSSASVPAFAKEAWTGPYVGTFADVSFDEVGFEDFGCWNACTKATLQGTNVNVGITAGYDLQVTDSLVVGVIADIGTGSSHELVEGRGLPTTSTGTFAYSSEVKGQGTVRAKAGLVSGQTALYLTAGVAVADVNFRAYATGAPLYWPLHSANFETVQRGHLTGPVFGIGLEHRFGRFSAKAEVLATRFQKSKACFYNIDGPNPGKCWQDKYAIPPQMDFTYQKSDVRFGLNYRF